MSVLESLHQIIRGLLGLTGPMRIIWLTECTVFSCKATIYSCNTHHELLHQDIRIVIQTEAEYIDEGLPSNINVILKYYNKENIDM